MDGKANENIYFQPRLKFRLTEHKKISETTFSGPTFHMRFVRRKPGHLDHKQLQVQQWLTKNSEFQYGPKRHLTCYYRSCCFALLVLRKVIFEIRQRIVTYRSILHFGADSASLWPNSKTEHLKWKRTTYNRKSRKGPLKRLGNRADLWIGLKANILRAKE